MKMKFYFLGFIMLFALAATAQTAQTYYWVGGNGVAGASSSIGTPITWQPSSWNMLQNGTGSFRTSSAGNDILIIDGNASTNKNYYLGNIPRDSCGQLQIINGAIVTCVTVKGINLTSIVSTTNASTSAMATFGNLAFVTGMPITGTGIAAGTTISALGSILNINNTSASTVSGSTTVSLNVGNPLIVIGMGISGTGITAGSVVTSATTPTMVYVTGATSTSNSITLTSPNAAIVPGMGVSGSGIPLAATVTAYDGANTVTISLPTTTTLATTPITISTQQTLTMSIAATASTTAGNPVSAYTTGQTITLSQNAIATSAVAAPVTLSINADAGGVGSAGTVSAITTYSGSTAQVTGSGANFTTAFRQGDYIISGGAATANYNFRQMAEVLSVNSDNDMTIAYDAPVALTAGLYYKATMLYIKGSPGLLVDATSTLNMSNTWGSGGNPVVGGFVICLQVGATGAINNGSSSSSGLVWGYGGAASRMIALSPNALVINGTVSIAGYSTTTTIFPFGSALGSGSTTTAPLFTYSTNAPGITFASGSNYYGSSTYKAGGAPFGVGAANFVAPLIYSPAVSFQPNSNYFHTLGTSSLALTPYFLNKQALCVYGNLIFNTGIFPSSTSPALLFNLNAAHIDNLWLQNITSTTIAAGTSVMNIYKGINIGSNTNTIPLGNVIFQGPTVPYISATSPASFITSQFYTGINNISTSTVNFGAASFYGTAAQSIFGTTPAANQYFKSMNVTEAANVALAMNLKDTGNLVVNGNLDLGTYSISAAGATIASNMYDNGGLNKTYSGAAGASSGIVSITNASYNMTITGISTIPIGAHVTCVNNAAYIPANTTITGYGGSSIYYLSNAATATANSSTDPAGNVLAINIALPNGTLLTANTGGLDAALPGFTNYNPTYAGFGTPVGSYNFYGATSTPFLTVSTPTLSAQNVKVGANVTMNPAMTQLNVLGNLNLNGGILTLNANSLINVKTGGSITGGSSTSYVNTTVNTSTGATTALTLEGFTTQTTFPVGNNSYYLPVTILPNSASTYSVTAFNGATTNGTPNGTLFTTAQKDTSVDAIYIVNRTAGTTKDSITLGYPTTSLKGSTFSGYTTQIGISNYNGTVWSAASGVGSNTTNTATAGFNTFGAFFVTHQAQSVVLPVKFLGASASLLNGTGTKVGWTVAQEINVDHYNVQRSTDGIIFLNVAQVGAVGSASYSWIDAYIGTGVVYYRILCVDKDNAKTYSPIVNIAANNKTLSVNVFPNPVVNSQLNIQLANMQIGNISISVYDINGRCIYGNFTNYAGGSVSELVKLPSTVGAGNYKLVIRDGVNTVTKTIFVAK